MSVRLEMLQVARLAPKVLGESAGLVRRFLRGQQNDDGGFQNRTGQSDLYYTVFGLEGLIALQASLPTEQTVAYLKTFDDGEELDLVHLCCLTRCWAAVGSDLAETWRSAFGERILRRLETFRAGDGGYSPTRGNQWGTAYGCFLALGAYQDLKSQLPEPTKLIECLRHLRTPDGGWANERNLNVGSTNATAAAITVLRNLAVPIERSAGDWLLARCHPQGGFLATPNAPLPDLLTTATALHALAGLQVSFERVQESCLDFIDSLWTNEGGFHGHWSDDHLDCEYTFYGLLALGHLSF